MSATDPLVPAAALVRGVRREGDGVVTLRLEEAGGTRTFAPGQFNMLYAVGVGEAAISVSGDPERRDRLLHTIRAVGPTSGALCRLRKGDLVGLRGPYGRGWPLEEARGGDVLLVAGGLGLAPLRPAIYRLIRQRKAYGQVSLLLGARQPQALLYRAEVERWRRRIDVRIAVDRADRAWRGQVGVVTDLLPGAPIVPARTMAMVCGPEVMMHFVVRGLGRLGVPDERIHVSLERNMKCAVGFCGHCQLGPAFVCKDGPVISFDRLRRFFFTREL